MQTAEVSFGYTTEYQGDYNELVYLRARMYAPGTGRFITRDTWEGNANNPLSFNRWGYVEGNPVNYIDPTGFSKLPPWVKDYLELLRLGTKMCYEKGDTLCVYQGYYELANYAPFFGFPYSAAHLKHYLSNRGTTLEYVTGFDPYVKSSRWVFGNSHSRKPIRQTTKDMWREIHKEVAIGKTSGTVSTEKDAKAAGYPEGGTDLYYALGDYYVYVEADYEVSGCYDVTVHPTYYFKDTYDWHPGLPAGGNVGGLAGFQDDWAASLKPTYAQKFDIVGTWKYPNKIYRFNSAWPTWSASKNAYSSWEYLTSMDQVMDVFRLDD